MNALSRLLVLAFLAVPALAFPAPALAQVKKDAVAPPAVAKEFSEFIAKFRAALKADDGTAIAALTQLPYENDAAIATAEQFRAKVYKPYFKAKTRSCIQGGKAVYDRDGLNQDNYFVFCGESIFTFTRTPAGFRFTSIGAND